MDLEGWRETTRHSELFGLGLTREQRHHVIETRFATRSESRTRTAALTTSTTTPDATMSTTITSLLNSLHTHLQSQTQLLPTLHAQLGLPPTALHDELSALQQQLTQCIESQIDLRRKQVDEWMEKCSVVEEDCLRYGNALGSHLKSSGPSVGEIRKEQVLPRRFELISEHQEKLRQVSTFSVMRSRTLAFASSATYSPGGGWLVCNESVILRFIF